MLIELIASLLVFVGIFWLTRKRGLPFEIPIPEEKEHLSLPHKMRRIQQALKRQYIDLDQWESKLAHETQELSIANQMLDLGEKHLGVNTSIVQLRESGLDLQQRENDLQHGLNMLEFGNVELGMDKKLLQIEAGNTLLDIGNKQLELQ